MSDFFVFMGMMLGAIVGIVLLALGLSGALDAANCAGFQSATGIETKWRMDCYANVNGKWVPAKYVFGDAKELRIKETK